MRVGFHTFGCKLNQYETEGLAFPFASAGFQVVPAGQEADLYLINTCTVTARADHKARSYIRGLARTRPDALVVVTGCAAQLEGDAFSSLGPNVAVVPQDSKAVLLDFPGLLQASQGPAESRDALHALLSREGSAAGDPFRIQVREQSFHTRAFLKIQDGCDCRCSYCRVPLARGASVSLEAEEVVRRARSMEDNGFLEIVLTGVNISAYRSGGDGLPGLLSRLLRETDRVRFRLSSLEPDAVGEELALVLGLPRVCPHFHLPVQSGSDEVLRRMRRRYASTRVREAVRLIREVARDPFLAADIITGFPGETEADFAATRDLVLSEGFSALHVFPFSPRPGTEAAGLPGRILDRVTSTRAEELGTMSAEMTWQYAVPWVGGELDVLLEAGGGTRGGEVRGVTPNYLTVSVSGVPGGTEARGSVARARILSARRGSGKTRVEISGRFLEFVERRFVIEGDTEYTLKGSMG